MLSERISVLPVCLSSSVGAQRHDLDIIHMPLKRGMISHNVNRVCEISFLVGYLKHIFNDNRQSNKL